MVRGSSSQEPRERAFAAATGKERVRQRRYLQHAVDEGDEEEDEMKAAHQQFVDGVRRRKGVDRPQQETAEDKDERLAR